MRDLRESLIGYAEWLGYGHGERAHAWVERLAVNAPELDLFRALASPGTAPYRVAPARVTPAAGSGSTDAPPADAAQALQRARAAPELNAFTWLPQALPPHGPGFLAGVPVAVKDLMALAGAPLTAGSRAFDAVLPERDAEVVARLKRAGAVVVGLTNLHELAYGITSDNPRFGRVVNPAAPDRIPGGSSGGSAAAIAAGIVRAALGTDTAGSIRIPAACCGVAGFKPSYDAVPRTGVIDLAPTLDHVGPLGRRVEDCAALFAAMLELDAIPDWTLPSLDGVRALRLTGYFEQPLDTEVRAAVQAAMGALQEDGARCREQAIAGAETSPAIQLNTISPEATAVHADRLRERGADLGEDVRVRLEMGLFLPGTWYVKAQRLRAALVQRIESALAEADVLVCATLRTPAPAIGATRVQIEGGTYPLHTAVTNLTLPFNLAGLPAVSVPWAASREGVPIAVQIVGARGEDWRTLAIAQRLEIASPWRALRSRQVSP